MSRPFVAIVGLGAALVAASCAPMDEDMQTAAADEAPRECFFLSEVSGFTDAGEDRIHVRTGPSEVFLFETFGTCPDLDFAQRIGFDQEGPGTICRGIDVDLIVPTTIGPRRCPVRMIRKLSEAEEEAL